MQQEVLAMESSEGDKLQEVNGIPQDSEFTQVEHHAEMFMGMMAKFSPDNSIADKITAEHLDKQLDNMRIETEKHYETENERIKERKHARIIYAILGVAAMIAVVVLMVAFRDNPDAVSGVVEKLVIAAVSAFGGYGFGKSRSNNDDD